MPATLTARQDVEAQTMIEIRDLAFKMIRLERWIREAHVRGDGAEALRIAAQREALQQYRSALMRQRWLWLRSER